MDDHLFVFLKKSSYITLHTTRCFWGKHKTRDYVSRKTMKNMELRRINA